ncbi:MAG: AI-2E family transporter, partial [Nanoarchaeota archaeon]
MRELYKTYGPFLIIGLLLYLSFIMFRPYFISIIAALVIAYLFYPVYNWLNNNLKHKSISSLLTCFVVFLSIIIPSLLMINTLIKELPSVYTWFSNYIQTNNLSALYENMLINLGITINLNRFFEGIISSLLSNLQSTLASLPSKIINISLVFFFMFFFFKDGKNMINKITQYLPFGKKNSIILMNEIKKTMDAVVYGQIATAMIQAALATIAYSILGLKAPFFLGFLTMISSLIPMVGPAFIYIPISIILAITSIGSGSGTGLLKAVILLAFGMGVISVIDNVLKP